MKHEPTYLPSDNLRVTPATVPFRHCTDVQTRFTDIDMLGHINNNVYLSFMDLAKIDYFTAIGNGQLDIADIRTVVVHIDCDFVAPSYFGEQLQVWTTIVHVGQKSVTLEQRVVNAASGQTKCVGRTVMAGFDPATASGAPIDPHWLEAAATYEERPLH